MTHLKLVNHASIRYAFVTYSHNIFFYYAENKEEFYALRIEAKSSVVLVSLSHFLCTGNLTQLQNSHDRLISMSRIVYTCITTS